MSISFLVIDDGSGPVIESPVCRALTRLESDEMIVAAPTEERSAEWRRALPRTRPFVIGSKHVTAGAVLADAAARASGEILLVLRPGMMPRPGISETVEAAFRDPRVQVAWFAVLESDGSTKEPLWAPGSFTEEEITPLVAYRKAPLEARLDAKLHFSAEYAVWLGVSVSEDAVARVPSLCAELRGERGTIVNACPAVLAPLAPEHLELEGYSYLFYPEAKERDYRETFDAFLRREAAFLGKRCVAPPPAEGDGKVTVLIRTKNRRALLEEAIESVSRSRYRNLELVVVDTGSTDGTLEWLRASKPSFPLKVGVSSGPNLAAAANVGLAMSTGEFIAELDSDDLLTPDAVGTMVDALRREQSAGLAISWYQVTDRSGAPIRGLESIRHDEFGPDNLLRANGAGALRVWRRSTLTDLGGWDAERAGEYADDYDLLLRAVERVSLVRVPEVLYQARRHGSNSEHVIGRARRLALKNGARLRAFERRRVLQRGEA